MASSSCVTTRAAFILALLATVAVRPTQAGYTTVSGTNKGDPVAFGSPEAAAVQRAAAILAAAGFTNAADGILKLLPQAAGEKGYICAEKGTTTTTNPQTGETKSEPTTKKEKGSSIPSCSKEVDKCQPINVDPAYLKAGMGVALGALLMHERLHYIWHNDTLIMQQNGQPGVDPVKHAEVHCKIYWRQYQVCKRACTGGTAAFPGVTLTPDEVAAACKEAADFEQQYPWFKDANVNMDGFPARPPPPPPPPAGTPAPSAPKNGCLFPPRPAKDSDARYGSVSTNGDDGILYLVWRNYADNSIGKSSVDTGMELVRAFNVYETWGGQAFVVAVGGKKDGTQGKVVTVVDTDADLIVDAASTIATGQGLLAPSGVCSLRGSDMSRRSYVLDAFVGKVWNLADSNSDQIPDALGAVFADTAFCSDIVESLSLVGTAPLVNGVPGPVRNVAICNHIPGSDCPELFWWSRELFDTNGDGVADSKGSRVTVETTRVIVPYVWLGGGVGETDWSIYAPVGHTVQVLGKNPITNVHDVVRATGTTGSNFLATATLTTPMATDETYVIYDATTQMQGGVKTAMAARPQIGSVSPENGPLTGGTTVTITGKNFPQTPTVEFIFLNRNLQPLHTVSATVTAASSSLIRVETPTAPIDYEDNAEIRISGGGQEARKWFFRFR